MRSTQYHRKVIQERGIFRPEFALSENRSRVLTPESFGNSRQQQFPRQLFERLLKSFEVKLREKALHGRKSTLQFRQVFVVVQTPENNRPQHQQLPTHFRP